MRRWVPAPEGAAACTFTLQTLGDIAGPERSRLLDVSRNIARPRTSQGMWDAIASICLLKTAHSPIMRGGGLVFLYLILPSRCNRKVLDLSRADLMRARCAHSQQLPNVGDNCCSGVLMELHIFFSYQLSIVSPKKHVTMQYYIS